MNDNLAVQAKDPRFVAALRKLLEDELSCHDHYIQLLEAEQTALTQFDADKVTQLASTREVVAGQISTIQDRRLEFLSNYPEAQSLKLSQLVVRYCNQSDAMQIASLVTQLKKRIAYSRELGDRVHQMAGFSLSFIGGAISIIRSATHHITQMYSRKGKMQERIEKRSPGSALGEA